MKNVKNNPPTDLRKYSTQTIRRLIFGALILLIVVGIGLILLIYGKNAAFTGLLCVVGGLIPIILIILVFVVIDLIIRHSRGSE
jgi:hypothetical protein